MAAQNIISLGIDTSSFSSAKKKTLNEFIALFDKLKEYDGKVYSPVFGGGIVDFNNSLKSTNALLAEMQTRIGALNNQGLNVKSVTTAAAVAQVKDLGNEVENATKKTKEFKVQTEAGRSSIEGLGRGLQSTLTQLRYLAFILPGIGIAGLFNLAFEAIGNTLTELDLFGDKVIRTAEDNQKLNTTIKEQIDLFRTLREELSKAQNADTFKESNLLEDIFSANKARGFSKDKLLQSEANILSDKLRDAKSNVDAFFGSEAQVTPYLEDRSKKIDDLTEKMSSLLVTEEKYNSLILKRDRGEKRSFQELDFLARTDPEKIAAQKKDVQTQLDAEKEKLKIATDYSKKLTDTRRAYEDQVQAIEKFNEEERLRLQLEGGKSRISVNNQINERILKDEISSQQDRINAIKKLRDNELEANKLNLNNVLNSTSSTPTQKNLAQIKFEDDNVKANKKASDQIDDLNEQYRQRQLKAINGIAKDAIEANAIANERVYKDETKSLEERLKAYSEYITRKQQLQDLEKQLALSTLAINAKGQVPASERARVESDANKQKANIQADAEAQIYEIVKSSLEKQLKLVIQANDDEDQTNLKKYTQELRTLNKSFKDKEISYRQYKESRLKLDEEFRVSILQNDIDDDKRDIQRLNNLLNEQLDVYNKAVAKRKLAEDSLQRIQQTGGDELLGKKNLAEAIGAEKAAGDVIIETRSQVAAKTRKLNEDENKQAKANFNKIKEYYLLFYNEIKEITDALYTLAKTVVDAEYTNDLERLRRKKEITDEIYGYEKAALDKSALSAKDKNALEVQLDAQKAQRDKQAQAQERKLKRDQAIADQKLALIHIAFNTAEGISLALASLLPPFDAIVAAEKAALGTIQAATVLATPIPYKHGTPPGGHPGGLARYAEGGIPELVKEPYKNPYLVMTETVSYLPKGTEVIPISDSPEFTGRRSDGWEQTKYLARQIAKSKKEINNTFSPIIKIDLGFESYKKQILGN